MNQGSNAMTASPLCVDLDGSVIRTDLLYESLLLLIKRNALYVFMAVLWLLQGKAVLKAQVAARVELDPSSLPYNLELLDWLRSERARGRRIWLCTAANDRLADAIANHLGIFDGVMASDERINLAGRRKADRLVASFGYRAFDYCGNEWRDVAIWRCSNGAVVVHGGPALERQVAAEVPIVQSFPWGGSRIRAALRALRLHQWAKNVLIFIPLLAAHRAADPTALGHALLAFVAFSICASSVYLLNDMLDLEADRQHPRKRKRPFACGDLPLTAGFVLIPLLLLLGGTIAALLPRDFQIVIGGYYLLTLAYSLALKQLVIVDTTALALLYTVRVIAGAAANEIPLSFWLLLFSGFFFLSLAFVKRYAELAAVQKQRKLHAAGRGYSVTDLPMLEGLGIAAGYMSVLVLALYINSPANAILYRHPQYLWPLCGLLLYWMSRIWMKTHRGRMHDDPVLFALRDRVSLLIGVLAAVIVSVAI